MLLETEQYKRIKCVLAVGKKKTENTKLALSKDRKQWRGKHMKKIVSGLVGTLVAVMTMYFLIGQKDMKENIVDAKEVAFEIKAINETVNRNEIVEIKLQVNSSIPMGKVEAYINYDSEILEFVDASSEQINGTAGTLYLVDEFLAGNTQAEYTIRMKALAIGTSKITISDCYIEDESFVTINEVEKTEGNITVQVTGNYRNSSVATLKELLVFPGDLNEQFKSECYEYTMNVDSKVNQITLSAIPSLDDSIVDVITPKTLVKGKNEIIIKVTAQSGAKNQYKIVVNKK